jgi:hypothetical protein
MNRTSTRFAAISIMGIGMLVSGLPALSQTPLLREVAGQRLQYDTSSPDIFAPDLDRAFRSFLARFECAVEPCRFRSTLADQRSFTCSVGLRSKATSESVLLDFALNDGYGPVGIFQPAECGAIPARPISRVGASRPPRKVSR